MPASSKLRLLLAFRALLFVVLLPGTLAGYVPFRLLRSAHQFETPRLSAASFAAAFLFLAGAAILLRCVWDFFAAGQGTLAPVDPPKHLVVRGLYRFTRNPMYNGVIAMLLGEAWLFGSLLLFEYAFVVFLLFHLFVVLYEEMTLETHFGDSYHLYRKAVPRWGFTVRPYSGNAGTTGQAPQ